MLEASHNQALVTLAGSMGAAVQRTTRFKQRAHRQPRDPMPVSLRLCEAIASRDPREGAWTVMQHLLDLAFRDMGMAERCSGDLALTAESLMKV